MAGDINRLTPLEKGSLAGFTLIEAMVSVAMIALVWIAGFNVFITSTMSYSLVKHKAQALYAAQGTVERLRKQPFTAIQGSTSIVTIDDKGTPDNYTDDYNGTQVVTVYNDSVYYKRVIVDISWNEVIAGKDKTIHEYLGTWIASDPQVN